MKRTLLFFATLALCAVSCGTVGSYADYDRFQDGIYYKPDPTKVSRSPLSEDEFRYLASLDNFSRGSDSLAVERDTVYLAISDPYDWDSPWYYGYRYNYWGPYRWSRYSHWGYYSWGSPFYYWDYYDPFYWNYGWYGYPYYYGYAPYYGWGYPYHHHYDRGYAWHGSGTRIHRDGSATGGHYSRPGVYRSGGAVRTASALAKRDIDRIKVQRTGPKSTAINRGESSYSETSIYRSAGATRSGSSASSYRSSSSSRYDSSSSSSRSSGSSARSSSYSGGGHSGSSHSSGGGGYHGGGHR